MTDPRLAVLVGLVIVALFALAVVIGGSHGTVSVPDPEDAGALEGLRSFIGQLPGLGTGRDLQPDDVAEAGGCQVDDRIVAFRSCTVRPPSQVRDASFEWVDGRARIVLQQDDMVPQRFDLPEDVDDPSGPPEDRRIELVLRGDEPSLFLACRDPEPCLVEIVEP